MVVMNKNNQPVQLPLKKFAEILTNKQNAKNIINQQVQSLQTDLSVQAKSTSIFEIY
jgi:hypothetical protein